MVSRNLKFTLRKLKALSDSTRLKLLAMLMKKPLCVCEMTYALGLSQPTISRHVKQLEDAGFVESRREGTWTIYSIKPEDPFCRKLLDLVMEQVGGDKECKKLLSRLKGVDRSAISGDGSRRQDKAA